CTPMPQIAAHTKNADAISLLTLARITGISIPTARARAAAGTYGKTFTIDNTQCASVSELLARGVLTEADVVRARTAKATRRGMEMALLELLDDIVTLGVYDNQTILLISNTIGRIVRRYGLNLQLDRRSPKDDTTRPKVRSTPE